ncbi:hypothetical protein A2282_02345 [candidate division WOR-1 bacterium RIFOXYA12_FULL_36_13]|nr:MAG: hypothetical protein A2282_02345 [candidate division WOR-1 bacterium RIFOXYA12_FULL_36_13]
MTHKYWGKIREESAGISPEHRFKIPYFEKKVQVFLGKELLEDDEKDDLSKRKLDEFEQTFKAFLASLDAHIITIKTKAFKWYKKLYAHYYEDSSKSGKKPLNIDSAEKHFAYIKDIIYIRITDKKTLRIIIGYDQIDGDHGLEIKFVANKFSKLDSIAET